MTAAVTGLLSCTTYYFRIAASNVVGTSTGGDILSFDTWCAPDVVTQPVTGYAPTAATFNSAINPRGLATTYFYEYRVKNVTTPGAWTSTATPDAAGGHDRHRAQQRRRRRPGEADDVRGPRRRHQRARHGHGRHRRVHHAGHRRHGPGRSDRSGRVRPVRRVRRAGGSDGAPGAPGAPGATGARRAARSAGYPRVGDEHVVQRERPDRKRRTGRWRRAAASSMSFYRGSRSLGSSFTQRFGNRTLTRGRLVTCGSNPRPIIGARVDVVHVLPGNKRRRKTGLRSRANGRADADPADRPAQPRRSSTPTARTCCRRGSPRA